VGCGYELREEHVNRREFIGLLSGALAAGATYKEAFGKALAAVKEQEPGQELVPACTVKHEEPKHCGECEHFIEGGFQTSGCYGEEEGHWCQFHMMHIGDVAPEKLKPCRFGSKIVEVWDEQ
jgi:hypothetical protein